MAYIYQIINDVNGKIYIGKITNMYSLEGDYIRSFSSTNEAARFMVENKLTGCKQTTIKQHITEVCTGRRKTAAKYKWKYSE